MTVQEFLGEMSGDIPYEERRVKGIVQRNAEASMLLLATYALPGDTLCAQED